MRNRPIHATAAALLLTATLIGCEGEPNGLLISGPSGSARVRVFNALTSAPSIDLLVDGQVAASNVAFGAPSRYTSLSAGSHQLQVRSSTTGTVLLNVTPDVSTSGSFSLIPAPGLGDNGALLVTDDPTPAPGQGRVRVIHVAAAPGPVAVYVTAPDADLSTATAAIPALVFGAVSPYATVTPGTYRVRVTRVGNPGDVLLDTGGVIVDDGSVRSFILTDSFGGGLPTNMSIVSDTN